MKQSENGIEDASSGVQPSSVIGSATESSMVLDGGWGWIIVAVSFIVITIGRQSICKFVMVCKKHFYIFSVYGIDYSFGIFLGEFMMTFGTGRATASMVASTQMGMLLCIGPISAYLVEKFGCRKIVIVGSILAASGLMISGVAANLISLCITAGIMTGNF